MNGRRLRRTRPRFCQHGQPSDNRISHELAELIDWSDPTDTTKFARLPHRCPTLTEDGCGAGTQRHQWAFVE